MVRLAIILGLAASLAACVGPPRDRTPDVRPRPPAVATSSETRQCLSDLAKLNAQFTPIPDQNFGDGCTLLGAVQLLGAGVPVTNIKAIRCPLARALTVWTREALQPAARDTLGSRVVQIESMGAYACRNIIGGSGTGRSEHATGNAVDISAFVLADGRRISLRQGWNGSDDERAFLRQIRASACNHFQTVLSPDYNAAHYDHFHFDLGGKPFCR